MPAARTKNGLLEFRRRLREQRDAADAKLRASKKSNRSPKSQIELGLSKASGTTRLAWWVARHVPPDGGPFVSAFERLLMAVASRRSPMLEAQRYVDGLARLAEFWTLWGEQPEDWQPRSHSARRQFSSLARHLLARYPVPAFFDAAWLDADGAPTTPCRWFIHVGRGRNLRTAADLPFTLTKLMSHHALLAPDDASIPQALRWGQVRGMGGSERLARAVIGSRLRSACPHEPFWLTVVHFFVNNPMLDPQQVGPIVDYLHAQRFEEAPAHIVDGVLRAACIPQPNLSMKGRTVQSVLRQVEAWHRHLHREARGGDRVWPPSGIPGYSRVEGTTGNQRLFTITELLDSHALRDEGRVMRHCVASYAHSCVHGRCAIFSLRVDDGSGAERRLTIEVIVANRVIVQARGRYNASPEPLDGRILRAWATTAQLSIAQYVSLP